MVIWMDKWYTGLSLLELRTNLREVWSFTITDKRRPSLMDFCIDDWMSLLQSRGLLLDCIFAKVRFQLYFLPSTTLVWLGQAEVTPVWQGNIGSNLSPDAGYTPHNTPLLPHSYIQFRQSSLRTPDLCSKGGKSSSRLCDLRNRRTAVETSNRYLERRSSAAASFLGFLLVESVRADVSQITQPRAGLNTLAT